MSAPTMTPYAASKLINQQLLEDGFEKVLPPQMFYNYTTALLRKGKKPMIQCDKDGRITSQGLADWYTKYTNKLTDKVTV
jgi:hypothetical protein